MSSASRPTPGEMASPGTASPSSEYPFPYQDHHRKGKAAQRTLSRRDSNTSSIASIGGVLDTSSGASSSIPEPGRNAISTLLQHPIARTGLQPHAAPPSGGFKAPTQRDIPPVALTNIPHIEAQAFQPYIVQVGSLYRAFQRAKQEDGSETQVFKGEGESSKGAEWEAVQNSPSARPGHARSVSLMSPVSSPLETPAPKRRPGGQRRTQTTTPLSTIPAVYSEEDFHLENPRTFEIVSERSEIIRDPTAPPTGRKPLATNAILQEKLSWYMDTVEIHLINSISTASKSFFSALGSLRELHGEAAESVKRIQKLRKDLAKLDKDMAQGGLKVVNLKRRRENVRCLAEAIMQLEEIVAVVQKSEDMVERGEIDNAMDDIDKIEALIAGSQQNPANPARDLRSLRALNGVANDLNQLRYHVGKGYEARFHNTLLQDLRKHVDTTERDLTLQRWGFAFNRVKPGQRRAASAVPSYMSQQPHFRMELEGEMAALSRTKHTLSAATTFRALFLREMKNIIRKQLPSSNEDDNVSTISASTAGGKQRSQQEKSSTLARNLRAMDAEDSYAMLANIYTNISEGLRRLSVQVKVVLDITSKMNFDSVRAPPISPDPESNGTGMRGRSSAERSLPSISIKAEVQQALDLSSLLGEAVDAIQQQITKVVKVRGQQTADLPLIDFIRFFTLHRLFADECEAISGRSGLALKNVVDSQIKEYVSSFGNRQKHQLVDVMDNDKWDAKDFGDQENTMLNRVMDSSTADVPAWAASSLIWQQPIEQSKVPNGSIPNGTTPVAGKEKVRSALIDEQRFILPDSAIAMLRSIETFQHLSTGIPGMTGEIALSLLESLKIFNSRTSQLILGAGATRSAGLKNITTKHLALCSQALGFLTALTPYIREFFRRHLPASSASQIMVDFDKIKRQFQEHQQSIHEKFVDIMQSRASTHVTAMKKTDWEQAALNHAEAVSTYVKILTKETATLQKVLAKHLASAVVASIMIPVFASYRDQWSKAYQEVTLRSVAAKERMLADAEYFSSRISELEGSEDMGEHLVNVVKAKAIVSHAGESKTSSKEVPNAVESAPGEAEKPPDAPSNHEDEKE